jgi:tRNA 2-selenouridine synthase
VRIRSTFEERIQRIFREYVLEPKVNREDLLNLHLMSLQKISRALGGLRAAKMQELLKAAFSKPELRLWDHQPWIETLLKEYYDPMYEFSVKKEARTVVFEGCYDDVRNHIAHTLDRRRA